MLTDAATTDDQLIFIFEAQLSFKETNHTGAP